MRALIATVCVLVTIGLVWAVYYVAKPASADEYDDSVRNSDVAPRPSHLDELERRISTLESARSAGTAIRQPTPTKSQAKLQSPGDQSAKLEQRLDALERKVEQIVTQVNSLGEMPQTITGIKKALADKNLVGYVKALRPELEQRRMELWRRLLELAPDDPDAPKALRGLKMVYWFKGGYTAAREILDTFGRKLNLKPWELDNEYAHILSLARKGQEARSLWRKILAVPDLPKWKRAGFEFQLGYSYRNQGKYDDARRVFNRMIETYKDLPEFKNTVSGARIQLRQMTENERKKQGK